MKRIFFSLAVFAVLLFTAVLACNSSQPVAVCRPVADNALALGSGAIHLALLATALFFLWNPDFRAVLKSLGFPGSAKATLIYTVGGLVALFVALYILSLIFSMVGINDQQNVIDKISGLPVYLLLFAVVLAPFTEEIFFRGLLVPRIGIIPSALLFGVSHLTYGSMMEIAGVIVVGIILGAIFQRSRSITPCILVHLVYNGLSIAAMRMMT